MDELNDDIWKLRIDEKDNSMFPPPEERKRPLILVADDDPDLLEIYSLFFAGKEYDLLTSDNGEDALYKILIHLPDLVILDVMMPGLNGWQICKYLRARIELEEIGVLIVTAIGPVNNELTSPLFGADDYIDKPFELDKLADKIDQILSKRRPQFVQPLEHDNTGE